MVAAIIVSPGSAWSTRSQLELRHGHGVVAGARCEREHVVPIISRRQAAAGLLATFAAGLPRPAAAFENGIPDMELYRKQPKYPGTQPPLGLQENGKLATCDYAPNCFSTSGDDAHLL